MGSLKTGDTFLKLITSGSLLGNHRFLILRFLQRVGPVRQKKKIEPKSFFKKMIEEYVEEDSCVYHTFTYLGYNCFIFIFVK